MVLGAQIGPLPYPCLPACREARKAPPASPAPGVSLIIWTFPITVNILGEFPLQHPKRTRFRLFGLNRVRFALLVLFLPTKFSASFLFVLPIILTG